MQEVQVTRHDPTFSPSAGTYELKGCTGQLVLNDMGSVTVIVPNDSLTAFPADGEIMRVAFAPNPKIASWEGVGAFRVEKPKKVTLSEQEGDGKTTTIVGRSILSDFERATVKPHGVGPYLPDHNDRRFDWTSPELDVSAWTAGQPRAEVGDRSTDIPHNRAGNPQNFPYPHALEMAPNADPGTGHADPDGVWYAHYTYTNSVDQIWAPYATADDLIQVAVDGVEVLTYTEPLGDATRGTFGRLLHIPAGTHTIRVRVENLPRPSNPLNCSMFALAVSDNNGTSEQWLFTTASSGWKCLTYGEAEPGFTPGHVLKILIDECQAMDQVADWTYSFTATHDSNGNPWPTTGKHVFPVGSDLLSVLYRMRDEGWIDFSTSVDGLVLHAFIQGELGTDKSGTYTVALPASRTDRDSWLLELEHEVDYSTIVTKLLVQDGSGLGWFYVGSGSRCQKLNLGDVKDRAESTRIATETLARMIADRSITAKIDPPDADSVPRPSTWWQGDTVTVPDDTGGDTAERLVAMSWELRDNGLAVTPEFVGVKKDRLARLARVQARVIGSLGGRSESATVVSPIQPAQFELQDISIDFSWSGAANLMAVGTMSGVDTVTKLVRGQRIEMKCNPSVGTVLSGTTSFSVYLNGTTFLGSISLGPGVQRSYVQIQKVLGPKDEVHVVLTSVGSHPNGVISVVGTAFPQFEPTT
jgi:hypothetical protein